jgi:hypothetical protein
MSRRLHGFEPHPCPGCWQRRVEAGFVCDLCGREVYAVVTIPFDGRVIMPTAHSIIRDIRDPELSE